MRPATVLFLVFASCGSVTVPELPGGSSQADAELVVADAAGDPAADPTIEKETAVETVVADPGPEAVGCPAVEMVAVPPGTFKMGAGDGNPDELPVHAVTLPAFAIGMTEVLACQYQACVDANACTAPQGAEWGDMDPVVYIDWSQAGAFCTFSGARLCSEAEWEYAARNGGADDVFPWGDTAPTCDDAVFMGADPGCTAHSPSPSCSKPAGEDAWGVCDLAGNVGEWVEDAHHQSYDGAPADGSAWESTSATAQRVIRGGRFDSGTSNLRGSSRTYTDPAKVHQGVGTRCCRSGLAST